MSFRYSLFTRPIAGDGQRYPPEVDPVVHRFHLTAAPSVPVGGAGQPSDQRRHDDRCGCGRGVSGLVARNRLSHRPSRRGVRHDRRVCRPTAWAMVVPLQATFYVLSGSDVVTRRICVAAKNVDESLADSLHTSDTAGIDPPGRPSISDYVVTQIAVSARCLRDSNRRKEVHLRSPEPRELRRDSLRLPATARLPSRSSRWFKVSCPS
jgi:hypothetical protein